MEHHQQQPTDLFLEKPVVYAGFWERFGAFFIDGLVLAIPNFMLRYLFEPEVTIILQIIVQWLYYAIMESGEGQATLGKKALALKVTTTDGGRISFGQATGRYFGKIISTLILFIGYLMMIWDDKKQTLHDKMANTFVVRS